MGVARARAHAAQEFGLSGAANPDIIVRTFSLLSVEDVRTVLEVAGQAPLGGAHKAIILSASRVYHEAQNALLKLFEEPPEGTVLYLVVPEAAQLLPTLRSRVAFIGGEKTDTALSPLAREFLRATPEGRTALIKKLVATGDDEERRESRDEAIGLLGAIERIVAERPRTPESIALLKDVSTLRGYLYERSAPLKMILEHVSLILPKDLK